MAASSSVINSPMALIWPAVEGVVVSVAIVICGRVDQAVMMITESLRYCVEHQIVEVYICLFVIS